MVVVGLLSGLEGTLVETSGLLAREMGTDVGKIERSAEVRAYLASEISCLMATSWARSLREWKRMLERPSRQSSICWA